ncbi:MAG: AAA family ATPase, partial [Thermoproteota archaeon]
MSTVIEELRLRNFGGYRDVDVEFSAGLNLIRGRNSTGKSTLLDGLVFAIFGETPDVRPKLLISRLPDSREMMTYARFRSPKNGAIVEVMRKGRVDSKGAYRTEERRLRVNGEEIIVQSDESLRAKITELMGSSLRKFINLVYVRQGRLTEILQPPKDEMDSIIGITLLRELREQTEEARRNLERYEGRDVATELENLEKLVIPQLEKSLEQLSKDIEILQEEVRKLDELVRKGESREMTQLLKDIGEKDEIEKKVRETKAKIEELCRNSTISSPEGFDRKISEMMVEQMKLLETKELMESKFEKLSITWSGIRGEIMAIEKRVKEHEALLEKGISECPTCGQYLDPETLREIMSKETLRLQDLRSEEEKVKKIYDSKKMEIEQLNKGINGVENAVLNLKSMSKILSEYISLEVSLKKIVVDLENKIGDTLKKLGLSFQPSDPDLKIKVAQKLPIQPDELARKKADLE